MTCSSRANQLIRQMFDAALSAADSTKAVSSAIRLDDGRIFVEETIVPIDGKLVVTAIGKAAEGMALGALEALGGRIDSGHVVTKYGHAHGSLDSRFRVFEAGHPVPDQSGVDATRLVLDSLVTLEVRDTVLALISGGGSALFEAPVEPVSLDDFAELTELLLSAGAPIQDLNRVRIPLSAVKGGRLRQACPAGRFITLILSDVLGNDPRVVASGPTIPGGLSRHDALAVLERYQLREAVPRSVLDALEADSANDGGELHEDDDVVLFIADNASALEAAADSARSDGWEPEIIWREREGEASELAREWVETLARREWPAILLGGGEATVTVRGDGNGGRNTEFALSAALELERRDIRSWTVASLATDGQDAMTEAAGAIACAETVRNANAQNLDPQQRLENNDSLPVFEKAGGLVVTGPTGTNVNDLYFAVRLDGE
jgi:glycerate 2-kinase